METLWLVTVFVSIHLAASLQHILAPGGDIFHLASIIYIQKNYVFGNSYLAIKQLGVEMREGKS